eukprot:7619339-Heterocapsa_arctica.AAC.1
MPAGYTVCMACHCPFVFDEPQAGKPRRVNVPAMAAQVVMPGSLALDSGTRAQKQFSAKQLAKAAQGTEHYRSCSSDINNM